MTMNKNEGVSLLRQGKSSVEEWNRKHQDGQTPISLEGADLSKLNLREINMSGIDLSECNFQETVLIAADMSGTVLRQANLKDAKLIGVNMCNATLDKAQLQGADFKAARLMACQLEGVDIRSGDISGADMSGGTIKDVDFSDVDCESATFNKARLTNCLFRNSNLVNAKFVASHLVNVVFSKADMTGSEFDYAFGHSITAKESRLISASLAYVRLEESDFSGAVMTECTLDRAQFAGSNFAGAYLDHANIIDADVRGVNFTACDFSRARLIRSNFSGAIVENALVTDTHVQDVLGLPEPPLVLRLNESGAVLEGVEAQSFFVTPAIVEVYLSRKLSDNEIGCYFLHVGEMKAKQVSTNVYLTEHRHDAGGSILRFQARKYRDIYDNLPDILAPFRSSQSINWNELYSGLTKSEIDDQTATIIGRVYNTPAKRWRIAEMLPELMDGFAYSKVERIKGRGVSVTVAIDSDAFHDLIPNGISGQLILSNNQIVASTFNSEVSNKQRTKMKNKNNIKADTIGSVSGKAKNTIDQRKIQVEPLHDDLTALIRQIRSSDANEESRRSLPALEAAESSIASGDKESAKTILKAAGKEIMTAAERFGAKVVSQTIKDMLGM